MGILVAGGTGGVGPAVLQRLLADGHQVTATYRTEPPGPAAPGLTFVRCDVTDAQAVEALVGGVDDLTAVVNLVGGFASGPKVHESAPGDLQAMLDLNLLPTFLLARAAVPQLLETRGVFVAVSSSAVRKPFAGASSYLASKGALITLIESLDAEYGSKGLRANVLLPGTIDTPANRAAMPEAKTGTWVRPEDFAEAVSSLLASPAIRGAAIALAGSS